ncbi:hypothetical protein ABFY59_18730 [Priestia aryabhattai]|uniref:hypothetical protein n=1 Tax=Priestia aryabhattai TaxID=412384 RepID=UPI003D2E225F
MYIDKYQISEEEIKKVLNIYFKQERLIQIPKEEKKELSFYYTSHENSKRIRIIRKRK